MSLPSLVAGTFFSLCWVIRLQVSLSVEPAGMVMTRFVAISLTGSSSSDGHKSHAKQVLVETSHERAGVEHDEEGNE